ncbi:MAG: hypothetical protein ABIN25_12530 [Ginsengibacter sp.]
MKKVISREANATVEILKRILYSFQVLIVGIAIPVLFFIGISNNSQASEQEKGSVNHQKSTELVAKPAVGLPEAQM